MEVNIEVEATAKALGKADSSSLHRLVVARARRESQAKTMLTHEGKDRRLLGMMLLVDGGHRVPTAKAGPLLRSFEIEPFSKSLGVVAIGFTGARQG